MNMKRAIDRAQGALDRTKGSIADLTLDGDSDEELDDAERQELLRLYEDSRRIE